MKKILFCPKSVTILLLFIGVIAHGAEVKFNIVPVVRAPSTMSANSVAYVQYLITNYTEATRQLTTVPIFGVHQLITGASNGCQAPFILAHGQSCLLTLQLVANEMVGGVHSGPVVCATWRLGDIRPDPYFCSQPYFTDIMQVNLSRV